MKKKLIFWCKKSWVKEYKIVKKVEPKNLYYEQDLHKQRD